MTTIYKSYHADPPMTRVIVEDIHKPSMTSLLILADRRTSASQNLSLDQLRTLKTSLETGKPCRIFGLILTWSGETAVLALGSMTASLDKTHRDQLAERIRQIIGAQDELDQALAQRRGMRLDYGIPVV